MLFSLQDVGINDGSDVQIRCSGGWSFRAGHQYMRRGWGTRRHCAVRTRTIIGGDIRLVYMLALRGDTQAEDLV